MVYQDTTNVTKEKSHQDKEQYRTIFHHNLNLPLDVLEIQLGWFVNNVITKEHYL